MYLWGEGAVVGTRMLGAQLHIVWGKPVRVEGATEGSELRAATGLEVGFDREQGLEPVLYRAWRDVTCQIREIGTSIIRVHSAAIKNHREQSSAVTEGHLGSVHSHVCQLTLEHVAVRHE